MKKWYAVQTGNNYDWDYGSNNFKTARKLATAERRMNPGKEIRIAIIDEAYNYCDSVLIVYHGE